MISALQPNRRVITVLLLCGLATLVGCGPDRPPAFPASGQVLFANGTPVRAGTVELKSRRHPVNARGTIKEDGTFVLSTYEEGDGALEGIHDCVVVQFVVAEKMGKGATSAYGVVDPRFASYASSGLSCEVSATTENRIMINVEGIGELKQGGTEKDHTHHK